MIPPLPASTVEANPLFAKLWKHLTVELLDADASRKSENEARARLFPVPEESALDTDSVLSDTDGGRRKSKADKVKLENELQSLRVNRMKLEILRSLLPDVAYRSVEENDKPQSRVPLATSQHTAARLLGEDDGQQTLQHHSSTKLSDRGEQISSQLRDLLLLTTAYLNLGGILNAAQRLTTEEEELIVDEVVQPFKANLPAISSAIGSSLLDLEHSLTRLATIGADPPSSTPDSPYNQDPARQPATLLSTLTPQTEHLSLLRSTTLPASLSTLTKTLHTTLKGQSRDLQSSLLQLESAKHGIRSRHNQSHATFLATVASTMALKVRVLVLEQQRVLEANSAESQRWIRTKMSALSEQERVLDGRIAQLQGVLAEYQSVDPGLRVMQKLGERYAAVEAEMDTVRGDIARLEVGVRKDENTRLGAEGITREKENWR